MEGHVQAEVIPSKRSQKKRTKLLNKILQQMEFYFGDSNLAKDKFMRERLEENPSGHVDVDLFLKFNKIRSLTNNSQDIVDALASSEIIEISADRKQLKRKKPVERTDFDDCTIYVEGLPSQADQKYLRDMFSRFGTITHISIPHFKSSGRVKSFAFVEFASTECVDNVLKYVKRDSGKSDSGEESDDLKDKRSSGKARKSQSHCKEHHSGKGKEGNRNRKRKRNESESSEKTSVHRRSCDNEVPVKQPSEVNGKSEVADSTRSASEQESCDERSEVKATRDSKTDAVSPHKSNKKRKRKDSDNESAHKKVRLEQTPVETDEMSKPQKHVSGSDGESKPTSDLIVSASEDKESVGTSASVVHGTVPSESVPEKPGVPNKNDNCEIATAGVSSTMEGEASDTNCPSTSKTKKKRQRKRNKPHETHELSVLTKAEWKVLRNKYLTMQRAAMVHVKKLLRLGNQRTHPLDGDENHYEQEDENPFEQEDENPFEQEDENHCEPNPMQEDENQYEQEDENHCEPNPMQKNETVRQEGLPKMQLGVIIKIKFSEPLENFEKLKAQLKSCAGVCYVDGTEGVSEVYVRCRHPEATSSIIADPQFSELGDMKVLKGEEEIAYWAKAEADRKARFAKGKPKCSKRGRDKLLARATKMFERNKHVHFDD